MSESTESERTFHNEAILHGSRKRAAPFYSIVGPSKAFYSSRVLERCAGLDVLEYGSGVGSHINRLAEAGAKVTAIDIADEAVKTAAAKARKAGLDAEVLRMDAHDLEFDDGSFDRVCGSGILHHLDLSRAMSEVARVLRPEGNAIFLEPLGHNPTINWYRRRTPSLRTVDEHPLLMADLERFEAIFESLDTNYFHLMSLSALALRRTPLFQRAVQTLTDVDRGLFRVAPWVRRYAWIVVIELTGPNRYAD